MAAEASNEPDKRPEPSVKRTFRGVPGRPVNIRPDRRYVIANPSDENSGLQYVLDMGYHRVDASKDKERIIGGSTRPNGDVVWKGQVLCWIELKEFEKIRREKEEVRSALIRSLRAPGGVDAVIDATGKPASDIKPGEES